MRILAKLLWLLPAMLFVAMLALSGCGGGSPAAPSKGGGGGVPAGSKTVMTGSLSTSLFVVSNSTGQTLATIPLQGQGAGVAVNWKTKKAYVVAHGTSTAVSSYVNVVDTTTHTVLTAITLPPQTSGALPENVAVDETQNLVYVSYSDGTITVIDGATDTRIGITTAPVTGNTAAVLKVNPQTGVLYGFEGGGNLYRFTYTKGTTNYTSGTVVSLWPGFWQGQPAIDIDPATNTIYVGSDQESNNGVSSLYAVNGGTGAVTKIQLPGAAPSESGIAVDSAGKRAYVSSPSPGGKCLFIVDLTSNTVINSVPVGNAIGTAIDRTDGTVGILGVGVSWSYDPVKNVLSQAMTLPGQAVGIAIAP